MNNLLLNAMNLLADAEAGGGDTKNPNQWIMWVILGVVVVLLFAWFFFSGRKNKQKQKEYVEQLDAIAPGNKVKTAGGICGIVTEVCDDNTVIIKTGSEDSGYSFIKMEKELIAQTDAKGASQIAREEAAEKKRLEKEAAEAKKHGIVPETEKAPEAPAAVEKAEETKEEPEEQAEEAEAPADELKEEKSDKKA